MTIKTMEEKKEDAYEEEESFLLFIAREVEESEETAHTNTLVTARTSANTTEGKNSKNKKIEHLICSTSTSTTTHPARPVEKQSKRSRESKREKERTKIRMFSMYPHSTATMGAFATGAGATSTNRKQHHHLRRYLNTFSTNKNNKTRRRSSSRRRKGDERRTMVSAKYSSGLQKLENCVDSGQFDRPMMEELFTIAEEMAKVKPGSKDSLLLQGYLMSTLFYEASTRTRLSFESAMGRLGGGIVSTESAGEYSSAAKGETLEDTMRTVESYCDIVVLRHFQAGSAAKAAKVMRAPLINAGDGPGQHPTQALLDVYTIQKEIGRLDGFKIAFVGDLANGRTVRSLAMALTKFNDVEFFFVAPDVVKMKDDIKLFLDERGVKWSESTDLIATAKKVDVMYQTRIQKERFGDRLDDYEKAKGKYIIDQSVMDALSDTACVMHPLPRVDEIDPAVDGDKRSAYFRQAQNGLFVRMALLKVLLLK